MAEDASPGKKQSWGDQLGGIFKITNFIHRYRLFSIFLHFPRSILNGIGSMLAPIVLKSKRMKSQIYAGIDALYGEKITPTQKHELYLANLRYLIQMYLDAMLKSANIYAHTVDDFITFKNIHYLDEALAKGNGAIITTLHTGMFFHSMAGLVYHPKKYPVLTVVQPKNMMMYRSIITRPELRHFKVIPNLDFQRVRRAMINQLQNNGIVLTMFDYSKASHLRIPAHLDKLPFLVTTPQSSIRLQTLTGAPIIPALIIPDGVVGKSIVEYQKPLYLNANLPPETGSDSKEYHGKISIHLSKIFYNFLLKYSAVWEELRKLEIRISHGILIDGLKNISEILDLIKTELVKIIENSYEPDRNDAVIIQAIEVGFRKAAELLIDTEPLQFDHKYIDLSGMTGVGQIRKVMGILEHFLIQNNQILSAEEINALSVKLLAV